MREIAFLFGICCSIRCCLKFNHVNGARGVRTPAHGVIIGYQERALGGKRAAEMMKQLTQIRTGLGFVRLGPEKECEMFPRLRDITVQDQECEQRLQPMRADRRDELLSAKKAQL